MTEWHVNASRSASKFERRANKGQIRRRIGLNSYAVQWLIKTDKTGDENILYIEFYYCYVFIYLFSFFIIKDDIWEYKVLCLIILFYNTILEYF